MTLNINITSLENLESELAVLRTRYSQAQGSRDLLVSQRREKQAELTAAQPILAMAAGAGFVE